MSRSDQRTWNDRISQKYACADCGGSVYIKRAAPIHKGSALVYKCIRCGSEGGAKDKLTYSEPKLTNLIRIDR